MKVPNEDYKKLLLALIHTQLQLEVMDEVKGTTVYRHDLKFHLNKLEKEFEKMLEGPFVRVYNQEEQNFRRMIKHISYITEWVSESSFEKILTLGQALKNNDIAFGDDSPEKEPDCKHENAKLFQSGYKQCQDCKWIWKD